MSEAIGVSFRIGLVTPVGGCWEQTANAVRSTIIRRQAFQLNEGQFVRARVDERYLSDFVSQGGLESRMERCSGLLAMALDDLEAGEDVLEGLPTFLALPDAEADTVLNSLQDRRNQGQLQLRKVFSYGPAGGIAALRAGLKFLQENDDATEVLVCAVDSLTTDPQLEELFSRGQLLELGAREGTIPGEGAVAMILRRHAPDSEQVGFELVEPAFSSASGDRYDETGGWSETLSQVLEKPVEAAPAPIATVFVAYDGSGTSAEEWTKASTAFSGRIADLYNLQTPALCFGGLGAPAGLVNIALAVRGISEGYLPGPALIWAVSEDGKMGATAISKIKQS